MGTDCPFTVLGLSEDCTRDELAHAFRSLARRTHPDHGGDATEFRRALAAYRDAQRRVATRSSAPSVSVPVSACHRRDPYRSFLDGLDAAARIEVVRPVPGAPSRPATVSRPAPASARRFAEAFARAAADLASADEFGVLTPTFAAPTPA
jgi:hypothetical protein